MKYNQPYGVSDPDAPYQNGNPSTGTMGSIPPAASIEYPQREIANFIADARLTPDNSDLRQLGKGIQSNGVVYCDDQGTLNQLVITVAPNVAELVPGMVFIIKSPRWNTGPATLKVNGLPPVPIVRATDQAALDLGDIAANAVLGYEFDGTSFQMVWSQRQPGAPIYLIAPRTYYVNATTGNDAYDGQAAVVGGGHGPYRTIQQAANQIGLYNMNGFNITIYVADGDYPDGAYFGQQNGSGSVFLWGNRGNPAACRIHTTNHACVGVATQGYFHIGGFKLSNTGPMTAYTAMEGIGCSLGGTWVTVAEMEFGQCTGFHMALQWGAQMSNETPSCLWKVTGNAMGFVQTVNGSLFGTRADGGAAINIAVPINYGSAFVKADYGSNLVLTYGALTGAANVTGQRYSSNTLSTIAGGGGSPTYYPGTVAGAVYTGGIYA